MTNEIKESRVKKINVVVGSECHCDVCGSLIFKKSETQVLSCIDGFWTLTTGHHDWGNDSCDSVMCFDLCSKECIQNKFDEYMDKCLGTYYFELRHHTKIYYWSIGGDEDDE